MCACARTISTGPFCTMFPSNRTPLFRPQRPACPVTVRTLNNSSDFYSPSLSLVSRSVSSRTSTEAVGPPCARRCSIGFVQDCAKFTSSVFPLCCVSPTTPPATSPSLASSLFRVSTATAFCLFHRVYSPLHTALRRFCVRAFENDYYTSAAAQGSATLLLTLLPT